MADNDVPDYTDTKGEWAQLREIEDGGAILVRPDNHVGWRSINETTNPADDLAGAISSILSR
jgi:2,4-dichlorophenol 6-monooxygenase